MKPPKFHFFFLNSKSLVIPDTVFSVLKSRSAYTGAECAPIRVCECRGVVMGGERESGDCVCNPTNVIECCHIRSFSDTESPIYVLLCVLCFDGSLHRFYLTTAAGVKCRVIVVNYLSLLHHSAFVSFGFLGINELSPVSWKVRYLGKSSFI